MILTVTPNTAVDKTYTVENFRIDRMHRTSSKAVTAGGKGINVSRVYHALGGESLSTGFIGGRNGDFLLEHLRAEGLKSDFVRTEGESREKIAIVDPVQKTQTELNESGPEVSEDEVRLLMEKFESLVPGMEYAMFCGSTPPGCPDDLYAQMIEIARRHGVRSFLDASGEQLLAGLRARPYIAKPNVQELSGAVGRQLATIEETVAAAQEYQKTGIELLIVTLGRDGALVVSEDGVWWARSPEIQFVSAVGSGDALASAFVYVLSTGGSVVDALRLGTAAGAANAMYFGAGFCTRDDIYRLAEQVEVSIVSNPDTE